MRPDRLAFVLYLIAVIGLILLSTISANAQSRCAPLESVIEGLGQANERIVWEGTMPTAQGAIEALLFQSAQGTWTFVVKQGTTACFMAAGTGATPIETGRGL